MVEVFRTNVDNERSAEEIIHLLQSVFPTGRINFDLQDRDKILRVQVTELCIEKIKQALALKGFWCETLED